MIRFSLNMEKLETAGQDVNTLRNSEKKSRVSSRKRPSPCLSLSPRFSAIPARFISPVGISSPVAGRSPRPVRMTVNPDLDESGGGRIDASRSSRTPFIRREPEEEETYEEETETDDEETETDEDETRDGEGEGEGEDEEVLVYTAPTREEAESLRQVELQRALERLRHMCCVLGLDYKKKLLEMGVTSVEDLEIKRVSDQVDYLQVTIEANYNKLKIKGRELLEEWELSDTPMRKMIGFAHVIAVSDSMKSDDIVDANFLSTPWLKRAQTELKRLQTDREKAEKRDFQNQKERLKEIVFENHLAWADVGYDPKRKVASASYPQETHEIRKGIEKAKELSVGRKEMVFRMELVRQLIEQKMHPRIIRGHLASAKKHVEKMTGELPIIYDGDDVKILLDKFEAGISALEDQEKKEEEERLRMLRVRTRHGRSPSPDASSA